MSESNLVRRDFLKATALAGSALALGTGAASPPDEPEPWFDRPMLWAQLTVVKTDPGQYDLKFWLDYFARTHSDGACLSAGGCVAGAIRVGARKVVKPK